MVSRKTLYADTGMDLNDDGHYDDGLIMFTFPSILNESAELGHYENDVTAKPEQKREKLRNATRQYLHEIDEIGLLERAEEMQLSDAVAANSGTVKRAATATGYGARRVLHLLYMCLDGHIDRRGGRYSPFDSPGRTVMSYGKEVSYSARKLQPRAERMLTDLLKGGIPAKRDKRISRELAGIRTRISDMLMPLNPEYSTIIPIAKRLIDYHNRLLELEKEGSGNGELTGMAMEIGDLPRHFKDSLLGLKAAYDECERARRTLVEGNLRLVVSIAKKYQCKGLSLLDLIGYGNVGLMKAVDRPYERGKKFSYHAGNWIRSSIQAALNDNSRLMRISSNALAYLPRFQEIRREMRNDLGREPSPEEMAAKADLPAYVFKAFTRKFSSLSPGEEQVYHFGDDESAFLDTRKDTDPVRQAELSEMSKIADNLDIILGSGHKREADIIKYKLAYYNDRKHTNLEISEVMGVTKERVRQLEMEAFELLRKNVG